MKNILKDVMSFIVPRFIRKKIWACIYKASYAYAKMRFDRASNEQAWLGIDQLKRLQNKYPFSKPRSYDPKDREEFGAKRAQTMLPLFSKQADDLNRFLELGSSDATVSLALLNAGKDVTAIDLKEKIKPDITDAGVKYYCMSACDLKFEDNSFDVAFSYDAFEHFDQPDKALAETIRVVRKGGLIYWDFSPLYMSPLGLHAYRSITVPYCQHLFKPEALKMFSDSKKLPPFYEQYMNQWSAQQYRQLWKDVESLVDIVFYTEQKTYNDLGLIAKYPSCFKSKADCFEDFVVAGMKILLRKK